MTTIAWDGKTLAADRQMNNGTMPHLAVGGKLYRGTYGGLPALFAGSGTSVYTRGMIDWLIAKMPPDNKPEIPTPPDSFTVIAVTALGVFEYIDSLKPIPLGLIPWAIGSGADFAFGAMAAGATAKRAVEIACKLDVNSGLGVDTRTLK